MSNLSDRHRHEWHDFPFKAEPSASGRRQLRSLLWLASALAATTAAGYATPKGRVIIQQGIRSDMEVMEMQRDFAATLGLSVIRSAVAADKAFRCRTCPKIGN